MSLGSQIRYYRKKVRYTQQNLADELGITPITVSNWENDISYPTVDRLQDIASKLKTNVNNLINDNQFEVDERYFDEKKMKEFINGKISSGRYPELEKAMKFADKFFPMLEKRKGKQKIPYENHPLNMVCHAFALGLDDDVLLAATLLHDAGEKLRRKLDVMALPVSAKCINIIRLLTKEEEPKYDAEKYYAGIKTNPKACLIKCIGRCNNLSSYMVGFKPKEISESIVETEEYIYPLLKVVKKIPEYNNAAFLLYYQMKTIVENLKYYI